MRIEEFNTQMLRLIGNFGKPNYSDERSKLIWRDVQGMDGIDFARMVDGFISDFKFAPLGNDFREGMAKQREWKHYGEKKIHAKEAFEFYTMFHSDEIKSICETIKAKLRGEMSDESYKTFTDGLSKLVNVDMRVIP